MAESLAELAAMFDTPRPPATLSTQPTATMPTTYDWDSVISEEAKKYPNVPEPVVRALIARESSGNPMADVDTQTQWGKARGLGQFIDSTAQRYIPDWQDPSDSYDPVKNIKGIYAYLDDLTRKKGSIKRALVSYHGGGTDVLGTNSLDYARQILEEAEKGGKRFTVQPEKSLDELASMFTTAQEGAGITTDEKDKDIAPVEKKDGAENIWTVAGGTLPDPKKLAKHYLSGIQGIIDQPLETLFPGAAKSAQEGTGGFVSRLKDNTMAFLDVLNWLDRAYNYATGNVQKEGAAAIKEAIPGEGIIQENLKTGVDIATSPSTYIGAGTIKKALQTPQVAARDAMEKQLGKAIEKGVSKGIKPTVVGKPTLKRRKAFYSKAEDAVNTITENRNALNLVNEAGEQISRPRSAAEMAQAIDQTKKIIYKQYHDMATAAGDAGSSFNLDPITNELSKISDPTNLKVNPKIREYASELFDELSELDGAAPDVIEARIADLNNSLASYYAGRTTKAVAQVDASVAKLMREQLDKQILSAGGEGYQALKNKYGALKAIETEVNKRALVNARRAGKTTIDMTDIFTGGDLVAGILTINPALIAKAATGRAIKEAYKWLYRPDAYVNKMFKTTYSIAESPTRFTPKAKATAVGGGLLMTPTQEQEQP